MFKAAVLLAVLASLAAFPSDAVSAQSELKEFRFDPLGRLKVIEAVSGQNGGESRTFCYDAAGNRVEFKSASGGSAAACDAAPVPATPPTGVTEPEPQSTPDPASNIRPQAVDDYVTGNCNSLRSYDVVLNDSDEDDARGTLSVVSVTQQSGRAGVYLSPSGELTIGFAGYSDVSRFTYRLSDPHGATDTAVLTVETLGTCSGIDTP